MNLCFSNSVLECPTGKLDKEKFVEYYKLFRKNENVDEIAKHCFKAFDFDRNGYIDFREFLIAYVQTTDGADLREKLDYVFQIYDVDDNKVIDESEIRLVLKAMFRLLNIDENNVNFDKCVANILEILDQNKDSKISKGEFIEGIISDSFCMTMLSPFH